MTISGRDQNTREWVESELRRRLEEAEETLRAIREGEVDALVMRNPQNEDEVFTLEGRTESYRDFMEAMDTGAAAFDGAGKLIYANKALSELLGQQEGGFAGIELVDLLSPADRDAVQALIQQARSARGTCEISTSIGDEDRHILVSAAPLALGINHGVAATFTDITHRIRAIAAHESERAAHAIIASANEAVIVCNLDGIVTHANAAVGGIAPRDPIGLPFDEAFNITIAGTTGLMQGNDFLSLAMAGTPVQGLEAHAPNAPRIRDLLISAAPLKLGASIVGCVVAMVDLSQRKAAEKQQLLLMGELDHRVKNTLALVLSIAKRTASTEDTVQGFQSAFASRIQALAATHNLLAEQSWKPVPLASIIRAELAPHILGSFERLVLQGPDYAVSPRAAIALGLVIHELATNAAKYGALSNAAGMVRIDIAPTQDDATIHLRWKESGGPRVATPQRMGFGHTVITRSMKFSAGGDASISYPEDGVLCDIRLPLEDVVLSTN
jgi:PAS domain S-box-containing protein